MMDTDDLPLASPAECEESLVRIIRAVASGRMDDSQGRTLTALIRLKLECADLKRIKAELEDRGD